MTDSDSSADDLPPGLSVVHQHPVAPAPPSHPEVATHTIQPSDSNDHSTDKDDDDDDDDLPPGLTLQQSVGHDVHVSDTHDEPTSGDPSIDELVEEIDEAASAEGDTDSNELIDTIINNKNNPFLILQLPEPELTLLGTIIYQTPTSSALRQRHKQLTIQLHPDRYSRYNDASLSKRAELAYTLVGNAYETLRDEKKFQAAVDDWKQQHTLQQEKQSSGWDPRSIQQEIQQLSKQKQLTDINSMENQRRVEIQQYTTTLKDRMKQRLQSQQQKLRTENEVEQKIAELKQKLLEYDTKDKHGGVSQPQPRQGVVSSAGPSSNDSGDSDRLAAARNQQLKRHKKR